VAKTKKAASAELSAKQEQAFNQAKADKHGLTLVPAGKVKGNHLVEPHLVDGEPVIQNGMQVVAHV
jgi:hypothetical protein